VANHSISLSEDRQLHPFIARLGEVMQLESCGSCDPARTLYVTQNDYEVLFRPEESRGISLNLPLSWQLGRRAPKRRITGIGLSIIAQALAQIYQLHHCLLVHAALVEHDSDAVILACTGRPRENDRQWADAAFLAVSQRRCLPAGSGFRYKYMAHPWPTWSRFVTRQGNLSRDSAA